MKTSKFLKAFVLTGILFLSFSAFNTVSAQRRIICDRVEDRIDRREDVRDRREDVRDRREDFRDRRVHRAYRISG